MNPFEVSTDIKYLKKPHNYFSDHKQTDAKLTISK